MCAAVETDQHHAVVETDQHHAVVETDQYHAAVETDQYHAPTSQKLGQQTTRCMFSHSCADMPQYAGAVINTY